jgi:arylsulfatase A-like enzyme
MFLRLLLLTASLFFGIGAVIAKKPNVLLIMADDLGYSDLGCYGGEIDTPNLDGLAKRGIRFSQFYNTARCWPTRGALMTGYYPQQIRRDTVPEVPSGGRGVRPGWARLLPTFLKPQGYRSYHSGKWHIDGMPIEQGFDRSYYLKDQGRFFSPKVHYKDDQKLPAVERDSGFYGTTAITDHAVEVLKEHATKHSEKPFFHYLAYTAPHFPLHALPEDIAKYRDRYQRDWAEVRGERYARQIDMGLHTQNLSDVERDLGPPYDFPDHLAKLGDLEVNRPVEWSSLTPEQRRFQGTKMAIHAAMVDRMDQGIGRVLAQLKAMGELDNTLIFFLSDNGASAEIMVRDDGHDPAAPPGSADSYLCLGPAWSTTCNTPFRRHKTWTHEGGCSTPLIVSWPARLKGDGEFRHNPGHVVDIVPTILEIAGVKPPADQSGPLAPPRPGRSLVPAFFKDGSVNHDFLWWFHDGHRAVRVGDHKAVSAKDEDWAVYDLRSDRAEAHDLSAKQPNLTKTLVATWQAKMDEFVALAKADLPKPKKAAKAPEKKPASGQVLINGEKFQLGGKDAFIMLPSKEKRASPQAWIFYGPTLPRSPDVHEEWMHRRFIDAGIAVAGIDVGEMYGSPLAIKHFDALYEELVERRGFAKKALCLGRSRGGLWVSSWAIAHPERVAGIAGIYPVYDYRTYPGVKRAAGAYGTTAEELIRRSADLNPVERTQGLIRAKIPVFIIHGKEDTVVPLEQNSGALRRQYESAGAGDLIRVMEIAGQGHNHWPGFFQCEELVEFSIRQAKIGAK